MSENTKLNILGRAKEWLRGRQKSLGSALLSSFNSFGITAWGGSQLLDKYESSAAVYGAVSRIARRVSATQANLYKVKNTQGDSQEVFDHPALDLIYKCNAFQTKSEFWQVFTINKQITGEGIILKVRNDRGQVVELWNLRPDRVIVVPDPQNFIKEYQFEKDDGTRVSIAPTDIIHFKNPNPKDPLRGLSPILPVQLRVETEAEAARTQCAFFKNGARPDFLLTSEGELSEEQRAQMTSSWERRHKGGAKAGRMSILEGGLKYQQVSMGPQEVGYKDTLLASRDDIYAVYGVPKALVDSGNVNKTDAEYAYRSFITDTIVPELVLLFEVLNEQLIAPDFDDALFLDFVDPTPKDSTQQLAEWTAGVDRWITRNEIREEMNLPAITGGDSLFGSIANVEIGANARTKALAQRLLRGRLRLKIKLQLRETIAKTLAKPTTKKEKTKDESTPITAPAGRTIRKLIPTEIRLAYAEAKVKRLDAATMQLKKEVERFADGQQKRFINDAGIKKELVNAEKASAPQLLAAFNLAEENKLLATLTLPYITQYLTDAGKEALAEIDPSVGFVSTQRIEELLVKRAKDLAISVNNTTLEALTATLTEGITSGEGIRELSDRVQGVYTQFSDYRAERIARTEATAANNEGYLEGYQQSRVVNGKEWVATMDDRTRDEHLALDGESVGVNENFSNGLPYPQEINCRCVLAPVVIDE